MILFCLPSVINVILFAPFSSSAEKQYEMVRATSDGEMCFPGDLGQAWINVYYISYTLPVLLPIRWWKKLSLRPSEAAGDAFPHICTAPLCFRINNGYFAGVLGLKQMPRNAIIAFDVAHSTFV